MAAEQQRLREWAKAHGKLTGIRPPEDARGSEHTVGYVPDSNRYFKATRPDSHAGYGIFLNDFSRAAFRPRPWPAKRDGSVATLKLSGTLYQRLRLDVGHRRATVSAAPVYAALHQWGGTIRTKGAGYLRFRVGGSARIATSAASSPAGKPVFDRNGNAKTRYLEPASFGVARRVYTRGHVSANPRPSPKRRGWKVDAGGNTFGSR